MFHDEIVITVRSGHGGKGSEAVIKRTKIKRIPDGGNGGKGGDVIFVADTNVADLERYRYNKMFAAKAGDAGGRSNRTGHAGEDIILKVPCGTTIRNAGTGLLVRTLQEPGEQVIVAKGGRGGFGNVERRTKREGMPGEEYMLEYIIPADVCIVGMPNSGKSSLLHCVSNSKVAVNERPFSTEHPALGTYITERYDHILFCELPALIAGSSAGKGRGNRFLKHAGKARLIILILDPISRFANDLREQYRAVRDELAAFDKTFTDKKIIVLINKYRDYDCSREEETIERLREQYPVFFVSTQSKEGIDAVLKHITEVLTKEEHT